MKVLIACEESQIVCKEFRKVLAELYSFVKGEETK